MTTLEDECTATDGDKDRTLGQEERHPIRTRLGRRLFIRILRLSLPPCLAPSPRPERFSADRRYHRVPRAGRSNVPYRVEEMMGSGANTGPGACSGRKYGAIRPDVRLPFAAPGRQVRLPRYGPRRSQSFPRRPLASRGGPGPEERWSAEGGSLTAGDGKEGYYGVGGGGPGGAQGG